jgi:hypothetical protein
MTMTETTPLIDTLVSHYQQLGWQRETRAPADTALRFQHPDSNGIPPVTPPGLDLIASHHYRVDEKTQATGQIFTAPDASLVVLITTTLFTGNDDRQQDHTCLSVTIKPGDHATLDARQHHAVETAISNLTLLSALLTAYADQQDWCSEDKNESDARLTLDYNYVERSFSGNYPFHNFESLFHTSRNSSFTDEYAPYEETFLLRVPGDILIEGAIDFPSYCDDECDARLFMTLKQCAPETIDTDINTFIDNQIGIEMAQAWQYAPEHTDRIIRQFGKYFDARVNCTNDRDKLTLLLHEIEALVFAARSRWIDLTIKRIKRELPDGLTSLSWVHDQEFGDDGRYYDTLYNVALQFTLPNGKPFSLAIHFGDVLDFESLEPDELAYLAGQDYLDPNDEDASANIIETLNADHFLSTAQEDLETLAYEWHRLHGEDVIDFTEPVSTEAAA